MCKLEFRKTTQPGYETTQLQVYTEAMESSSQVDWAEEIGTRIFDQVDQIYDVVKR